MCLLIPPPAGNVHSHQTKESRKGSQALWEEVAFPTPWGKASLPPLGLEAAGQRSQGRAWGCETAVTTPLVAPSSALPGLP